MADTSLSSKDMHRGRNYSKKSSLLKSKASTCVYTWCFCSSPQSWEWIKLPPSLGSLYPELKATSLSLYGTESSLCLHISWSQASADYTFQFQIQKILLLGKRNHVTTNCPSSDKDQEIISPQGLFQPMVPCVKNTNGRSQRPDGWVVRRELPCHYPLQTNTPDY